MVVIVLRRNEEAVIEIFVRVIDFVNERAIWHAARRISPAITQGIG
jgi:hypothetical protein